MSQVSENEHETLQSKMSVKEYEKQLNDGYRRIESGEYFEPSEVTEKQSAEPSVHSVL